MTGVVGRADDFGRLGHYLVKHISKGYLTGFPTDTATQWQLVDKIKGFEGELRACAASLLLTNFPFQVKSSPGVVLRLLNEALAPLPSRGTLKRVLGKEKMKLYSNLDNDSLHHIFPVRSGPAESKTNIWFSEVWSALKEDCPTEAAVFNTLGPAMAGFTNDQATSAVLYAAVLGAKTFNAQELAVRMLRDPTGAKQLSNALKALGLNGTQLGAVLCEGNVLRGRGEGEFDSLALAKERTDIKEVGWGIYDVDQGKLADAVRSIFDEELSERTVEFKDPHEFWSSRWLWCANGSHNRAAERLSHGKSVIPEDLPRSYRKAYVESKKDYSIHDWSGDSYFAIAPKYEHGKTRAIYGGDTDTYIQFEHLLRPVESAWRGRKVILNPGYNGMAGIVERVEKLRAGPGINLMMDYEDFNSSHSLASQATVFRVLAEHVGYDPVLADRLVSSFHKSRILCGGKVIGHLAGTLMSGHRATSFINSVLNRAYMVIAAPSAQHARAMHVGDDLYLAPSSIAQAAEIMDEIKSSPLRMNPIKQSTGYETAEFLRCAIGPEGAYGYAARSVASLISGNWVSEHALNPAEGVNSMVSSAWSLMNRCSSSGPVRLLVPSLRRYLAVDKGTAVGLLDGSIALGNGPVRQGLYQYRRVDIREEREVGRNRTLAPNLNTYATTDYLSHHTSDVERTAVVMTGIRLAQVMAASSYKKSCAELNDIPVATRAVTSPFVGTGMHVGGATSAELLGERAAVGALSGYPLLSFMKDYLTTAQLRTLLRMADEEPTDDPLVQAWGGAARGVVVCGFMPRGDISSLSSRTLMSTLAVSRQINM